MEPRGGRREACAYALSYWVEALIAAAVGLQTWAFDYDFDHWLSSGPADLHSASSWSCVIGLFGSEISNFFDSSATAFSSWLASDNHGGTQLVSNWSCKPALTWHVESGGLDALENPA